VARVESLGAIICSALVSQSPVFHHCASLPYRPPVALGMELPIPPALGLGGESGLVLRSLQYLAGLVLSG
jgi:hypothetical protein